MTSFGPNLGYVDDLLEQYRRDPQSVSPAWREFFDGLATPEPAPIAAPRAEDAATAAAPSSGDGEPRRVAPSPGASAPAAPAAPTAPAAASAAAADDVVEPLRGVAARIVENMVASLS